MSQDSGPIEPEGSDQSTADSAQVVPAGSKKSVAGLVQRWWRQVAMVVLGIIGAYALIQAMQPDDATTATAPTRPEQEATTAAPSAAPADTEAPSVTTLPPTTTVAPPPPTTMAATTTTTPPTTTTSTTTTTTTTVPPPFIEPVGDPIPVEEFTLSILGIGDLHFGDPAGGVFGVLAASLGQPEFDSGPVTGGAHGTCFEGTFRLVRFGPLTVISRFDGDAETFDSFRIDIRDPEAVGPAAGLQTLSGFRAGATIAEFEAIYIPGFRISYTTHPVEGDIYELSSNQGLLLWGPITSPEDDGVVLGIFSPDTC